MRWIDRLSKAQRFVVIIALGLAADVLGNYLVALGQGGFSFGWYAYSPLTAAPEEPGRGLHGWLRVIIWLVLIGAWALGSLRVLRTPAESRPARAEVPDAENGPATQHEQRS
jgi:heme/copper-type cytochrome/quinol oxidase subunit 1